VGSVDLRPAPDKLGRSGAYLRGCFGLGYGLEGQLNDLDLRLDFIRSI